MNIGSTYALNGKIETEAMSVGYGSDRSQECTHHGGR